TSPSPSQKSHLPKISATAAPNNAPSTNPAREIFFIICSLAAALSSGPAGWLRYPSPPGFACPILSALFAERMGFATRKQESYLLAAFALPAEGSSPPESSGAGLG